MVNFFFFKTSLFETFPNLTQKKFFCRCFQIWYRFPTPPACIFSQWKFVFHIRTKLTLFKGHQFFFLQHKRYGWATNSLRVQKKPFVATLGQPEARQPTIRTCFKSSNLQWTNLTSAEFPSNFQIFFFTKVWDNRLGMPKQV